MTELYDYFYENIEKSIKVTIKHHKHHIHHTCHNHYPCPVITIITFHFILNLHVIFDELFVIKMLKQHSTTRNKQNPTVISSKSIANVS